MKKKAVVNIVIIGERGIGMSYSAIDLGRRDWYKKTNEAFAKEMERLRKEAKQIIQYGFE